MVPKKPDKRQVHSMANEEGGPVALPMMKMDVLLVVSHQQQQQQQLQQQQQQQQTH
ncbi:GM14593 [Drosophila sechellia]|uniref:GM14593 n=1 Tax=Drosophila sechellia TaxID=7238 RepID=B4HTV1_DROSE|nr:GM14593 [Drosophila sechellia]